MPRALAAVNVQDLARQGRSERGKALLQPVFEQFREGSDTADLMAAERLLATLA